ncbi:MAG TPA: ATP-dependent DNA helicase [Thermotogota bacterium]|nr:ATP-dependent DNA helicase [Thermotogota bacterium]
MLKEHSVSVRELIEFLFRSGNLDNRFNAPDMRERATIGTKAHKRIQKQYEDSFPGKYESEVYLNGIYQNQKMLLSIFGRADGIHTHQKEITVDEIKTTKVPLEDIDAILDQNHLRQCMCYGHMICSREKLESVHLRITYFNIDTEDMKHLDFFYSKEVLENFFNELCVLYSKWLKLKDDWIELRNTSIKNLQFPFPHFREGQRRFSIMVYHTIKDNKKLFAQAPTGTGKTLATLFPSIKAMEKNLAGPLFYLTSKTITRQTVENTLNLLRTKGLKLKSIVITAKEKMCINQEFKCNPYSCPYANGHYNRINDALLEIIKEEGHYSRRMIQEHAKRFSICPYELSLDLSEFSDCIICDYNYLFDPRAYLRRYFEEKGPYIFLIDEAHNLPDRSREMYSAPLSLDRLRKLRNDVRHTESKIAISARKLETEVAYYFLNENLETKWKKKELPEDIKEPLETVLKEIASYLMTPGFDALKEKLTDYFFELNTFNNAMERYDDHYITIYDNTEETLTLYCIDPSLHIREMIEKGSSCVFFSATLSPLDYYKQLFGSKDDDYSLILRSPFNQQRLCLLVNSKISTKYHARIYSAAAIVKNIELMTKHTGNYMVFFPSYKYMEMIYHLFTEKCPHILTRMQTPLMSESEREAFLDAFKHSPEQTFVGFVLMGGIFGEGIDLIGSRLSGAIIVGVGLPQIGFDRDIIKDYYQEKLGKGWEYAYIIPGANKVMQAVGRVIRSHDDKGAVILIDERFIRKPYPFIFPADWSHAISIRNEKEIRSILDHFWKQIP